MKSNCTLLTGGKCSVSLKSLTIILLLFSCFLAQAQSLPQDGDYRSKGSGNWNSNGTWQIYDASISDWRSLTSNDHFPGHIQGTQTIAEVTISPCHVITANLPYNYINIQKLTIHGQLTLISFTGNNSIRFSEPLQDVILDGGSIYWSSNPINLYLPMNCSLTIMGINEDHPDVCPDIPNGLQTNGCNASQRLYIGPIIYATCNGGGNSSAGSFPDVNSNGGTLISTPLATPSALCEGETEIPTLYGAAIRGGTDWVLTYKWKLISKPVGSTFTFNTTNQQIVSLGVTLTTPGDYIFELEVTADVPNSNTDLISRRQTTITVGGETEYKLIGGVKSWTYGPPTTSNHRKAIFSVNYNTSDAGAGSIDACSCLINEGAFVTIAPNNYMKLRRELVNNGTLRIQNNANLIQIEDVENSGYDTRVEKYVVNMNNVSPYDYVFWSSPVNGQILRGNTGFSPGTPTNYFYEYRESNDYFYNTPDTQFLPGKGYAIRAEGGSLTNGYNKTYRFTGTPRNGTIDDYFLVKSTNGQGYNLVGNPYPSDIDAIAFLTENASNIEGTLYFWTNNKPIAYQQGSNYNGDNYAKYTLGSGGTPAQYNEGDPTAITTAPSNIIKVGQGFIVQAKDETNGQALIFNNSMRLAGEGTFFQKATKNRFWLKMVNPNSVVSTILIGYFDGATNGYESDYDAKSMGASDDIYSFADNIKLAIQGKSMPFMEEDRIPLGARFFTNGTYRIELGDIEGLFGEQSIYIKDLQENTIHNLKESPYEFQAVAGEFNNRFELVFQDQPIEEGDQNPEPEGNNIQISKQGNFFVVNSSIDKISEVEIYNLDGRQVYKRKNINSYTHKIQSNSLEKSVLFVHVLTDKGEKVIKSIVNY